MITFNSDEGRGLRQRFDSAISDADGILSKVEIGLALTIDRGGIDEDLRRYLTSRLDTVKAAMKAIAGTP